MTILLTFLVVIAGSLLALVLLVGLRHRLSAVRFAARAYVDLFRAIPALVLMGTLYFCLPILTSIRISPFDTAFIALSLNLAPFVAECLRGAIESLPRIQYDSAAVLGFSSWQRQRYVTGPQIVRLAVPSLLGQYITTLKLTSLAASIGVGEIWHVTGQVITATSLPLEARLAGAGLYILVVLPSIWFTRWLERRLHLKGFGQISER